MIWVLVFGGIALAGLVTLVAYAVWLAHKASDLFAEMRVLGKRLGDIAELLGSIEVPDARHYNEVNNPGHSRGNEV